MATRGDNAHEKPVGLAMAGDVMDRTRDKILQPGKIKDEREKEKKENEDELSGAGGVGRGGGGKQESKLRPSGRK